MSSLDREFEAHQSVQATKASGLSVDNPYLTGSVIFAVIAIGIMCIAVAMKHLRRA